MMHRYLLKDPVTSYRYTLETDHFYGWKKGTVVKYKDCGGIEYTGILEVYEGTPYNKSAQQMEREREERRAS